MNDIKYKEIDGKLIKIDRTVAIRCTIKGIGLYTQYRDGSALILDVPKFDRSFAYSPFPLQRDI